MCAGGGRANTLAWVHEMCRLAGGRRAGHSCWHLRGLTNMPLLPLLCIPACHLEPAQQASVHPKPGPSTSHAAGLLLNNLSVFHGCDIVFDSMDVPEAALDACRNVDPGAMVNRLCSFCLCCAMWIEWFGFKGLAVIRVARARLRHMPGRFNWLAAVASQCGLRAPQCTAFSVQGSPAITTPAA